VANFLLIETEWYSCKRSLVAYAVDYRRNEFALNVLETQELQDRCDG